MGSASASPSAVPESELVLAPDGTSRSQSEAPVSMSVLPSVSAVGGTGVAVLTGVGGTSVAVAVFVGGTGVDVGASVGGTGVGVRV